MFYLFHDMHSGGYSKLDWELIVIEAESEEKAVSVFYSRFNRNPNRITCTCCGSDYSIMDYESVEDAFHYYDGNEYGRRKSRKIILADEIAEEEKNAYVPKEGYVWM